MTNGGSWVWQGAPKRRSRLADGKEGWADDRRKEGRLTSGGSWLWQGAPLPRLSEE